jgi:hypothetical protein
LTGFKTVDESSLSSSEIEDESSLSTRESSIAESFSFGDSDHYFSSFSAAENRKAEASRNEPVVVQE